MTTRTTRRGLLAAVAVAPATLLAQSAGATPAYAGTADGGRWWRLFARMERLDAEANRLGALADETGIGEYDDRGWRCVEISGDVRWKLLDLPAPDVKAALWKFDFMTGLAEGVFDKPDGCTPGWHAPAIRLAVLDVRRFIGGGVTA